MGRVEPADMPQTACMERCMHCLMPVLRIIYHVLQSISMLSLIGSLGCETHSALAVMLVSNPVDKLPSQAQLHDNVHLFFILVDVF